MPSRPKLVALVSLVLGTLLVHSPALSNGFLNWDDGEYLRAVAGFDAWDLLTEPVLGLHHPLTLASLALERAVFGEEPFWFHLSNVLLHTGCTVLVYVVVERLRGDREGDRKDAGAVAFGCAALFAVHPMHVESVAWVAERKDVLSTLLYLGALAVWLGGRQPLTAARLAGVFALFVAALLAKPMAVTLPVVLVALAIRTGAFPRRTLLATLPFFAVALLAGWLNLGAQEPIGAARRLDDLLCRRLHMAEQDVSEDDPRHENEHPGRLPQQDRA